jgi:hypothetical protein
MLTVTLAPPPDFTQFHWASFAATAISFKDEHAAELTSLGFGRRHWDLVEGVAHRREAIHGLVKL